MHKGKFMDLKQMQIVWISYLSLASGQVNERVGDRLGAESVT